MGGRGSSGLNKKDRPYSDYKPYIYGKITKYEAGSVYRAVKNGEIKARPETVRELYNHADQKGSYAGMHQEAYNRDHLYYDRIYQATSAINNKDFIRANKLISQWEKENIKRSTKKSPWFKYKKKR